MLTAFVMCVTTFFVAHGVTITYNLNGGVLPNGSGSYQADSNNNNNAVLDNPTKTGYIFTGWCDTNDYTAATNTCSNRVGLVTTNDDNTSKTMVRWTVPDDISTDTTFIAMWEQDKFQATTINLSTNDSYGFSICASGEFWVDWGDGDIEYINKTDTNNSLNVWHTYIIAGAKTIHLGGLATGYCADASAGFRDTIAFATNDNRTKLAGISGSLSAIFPTLNGVSPAQPYFSRTFLGCTNLTGTIPANLFSDLSGVMRVDGSISMFYGTFYNCINLGKDAINGTNTYYIPATAIPKSFVDPSMFSYTGLLESCPSGMSLYYTAENKVSCIDYHKTICPAGQELSGTTCVACAGNNCPYAAEYTCPNEYYYDDNGGCTDQYTITYDLNGGTVSTVNPTTYTPVDNAFTLNNPTKLDYHFVGWCVYDSSTNNGANCNNPQQTVTISQGTIRNKWMYAVYRADYLLCLHKGWYTNSNICQNYNSATPTFTVDNPDPTNAGYGSFDGWCVYDSATNDGANCNNPQQTVTISQGSTGDKYLYAKYSQPMTYTLDYNLNNGTLATANPSSYTIGTTPFTLNNPTRTGYIFAGWCENAALTEGCDANARVANASIGNGYLQKTIIPGGETFGAYFGNQTFYAKWVEDKFQVTTTNLSAGDYFAFNVTGTGTYYIDWGDGNVEQMTIENENVCGRIKSHTYTTGGVKNIHFGGTGTGNISFSSVGCPGNTVHRSSNNGGLVVDAGLSKLRLAGISGSFGGLFNGFEGTFAGCTNLTGSIPANLFSGISGTPTQYMFASTFSGCSGLTGQIPATLFSGISGAPADSMFLNTFSGCSGLTGQIPATLFSGISGGAPAYRMFSSTFSGCSGLTGQIPATLFSGISGTPAQSMFESTFSGCSGLGRDALVDDPNTPDIVENAPKYSIPSGLFSGISGNPVTNSASDAFANTFSGCTGLTGSIPATLFSGISGQPVWTMFERTFSDCTGLTGEIPATLFSGISGAPFGNTYDTFKETFSGCSNLGKDVINGTSTYYIPATTVKKSYATDNNLANDMFYNTGLSESCPSGTETYYTNSSKVSCITLNSIVCDAGTELSGTTCVACSGNGCPTTVTQYTCPNGYLGNVAHAECITAYTITYYGLEGTNFASDNPNPNAYTVQTPTFTLTNPDNKVGYTFNGWCVYNSAENTGANCPNPQNSASITNGSTGDRYVYAVWQERTATCRVGEYVYVSNDATGFMTCHGNCPAGYYCPGDNGNSKTYRYSDLVPTTINGDTVMVAGLVACDPSAPYSRSGSTSASACSVCPPTYILKEEDGYGVLNLGSSYFDLNGNNTQDSGECIDVMYTQEMQTCMMKAMCNNMPAQALQAMLGSNYTAICTQLASVTCDYAGDKVSYMTCRYNANTYGSAGVYTDCSKMVNICNETELLGVLSVLASNQSSAAMFPVELNARTDVDTSDLSAVNWNGYFYQNLMSVVAQIMGGADAGTAISSLDAYNTCSGGSSAFTCESNTWLHVGNEQICTYSSVAPNTKALAIRTFQNNQSHVYYVKLVPETEHDYPIHSESNTKLKIREYHANGSTVYNAYDDSVLSD